MKKDLGRFQAATERVVTKLSSFVIPKPEYATTLSHHNGVIQTGAYLTHTVLFQTLQHSWPQDFVRNSSVREAKASKSHPPKTIQQSTFH